MAKKYYDSNKSNVNTSVKIEDWDGPSIGVPEIDLGDSRQGLDKTKTGNSSKKTKISPRSC